MLFPESESDDEDDDDKLCIVEQACPSTPEPPTPLCEEAHLKRRNKPAALCLPLLPLSAASPRQSLGDAKYPIDLDAVEDSTAVETCFADEGYSSSSSPYDITEDYSSLLPFANYDGAKTTTDAEEEKDFDDEMTCEKLMVAEVPDTEDEEGQVRKHCRLV